MMKHYLVDYDYDIASDGIEAVELFKTKRYDLVLMDLHLPRLDGFSAALEISKLDPYLPILALSAFAGKTGSEKVTKSNYFVGFLAKPFERDELMKLIDKYLYFHNNVNPRTDTSEKYP